MKLNLGLWKGNCMSQHEFTTILKSTPVSLDQNKWPISQFFIA